VIHHRAGDGRSALPAVTLEEMGDEDVANLDSGIGGWEAGRSLLLTQPRPVHCETLVEAHAFFV